MNSRPYARRSARVDAVFFYLSPELWRPPFALEGQEAHHLARVLRVRPGEDVRLLDGQGREGLFRVEEIRKDRVKLARLSEILHPAPACRAILAVGWSKNARREFFLEKAVELGAAEIWFRRARRSQGRMPEEPTRAMHAQLIAGAKQCGNPYLPVLRVFPDEAEDPARRLPEARRVLLLEPGGDCPLLGPAQIGRQGNTVYLIGPEGGFAPEETAFFLNAGYAPASLGERPLRWETAALMCLSLHQWAASGFRQRPGLA